jgi:thioredoxin 1
MSRIISLFLLVLMANMASCQNTKKTAPGGAAVITATVSADEFQKKLAAMPGAQLVDVRSPEEYKEGHLKGSLNINVQSDAFAAEVAKLDKKKPVMVYCRSGRRSAMAQGKLEEMGFTEVYNLDGGITDWQSAGKPVE